MLISEFQMITGIYPTAKLYEAIDKAYMDSKLDKHEFFASATWRTGTTWRCALPTRRR